MASKTKRIDITLNESPAAKFTYIKKRHNLSDERAITYLIDTYFLDSDSIYDLKQRLSDRIKRGVPRSYISTLKTVYIYLGHILKKLGRI